MRGVGVTTAWFVIVAVAWVVAVPRIVRAQDASDGGARDRGLDGVSLLGGVVLPSGTTGLKAELGVLLGFVAPLSERVDLDLVIPLGIGWIGEGRGATAASTVWLDAVPSVQFVYEVSSAFAIYGQGGVGLSWNHVTIEQAFVGYETDSSLVALMRFVPGIRYAMSDSWQLAAEPLGISIYFSRGSSAVLSFLGGVVWTP